MTLNWLTCETADTGELLVLEMLEHILLGLPGSPLRKALIESGLGEDLTGGGLETDLRQTFFSVGLRSITPGTAEDVEMLIMETLAELAENGIPAAAVEAAVNRKQFGPVPARPRRHDPQPRHVAVRRRPHRPAGLGEAPRRPQGPPRFRRKGL